jgi:hypothetical protein
MAMKLRGTALTIATTSAVAAACSLAGWPSWRAFYAICAARSDPNDICVVSAGFEDRFYTWAPHLVTATTTLAVTSWTLRLSSSVKTTIAVFALVGFLAAIVWLPRPYFPNDVELIAAILGASIAHVVHWLAGRVPPNTSLEGAHER